MIRFDSCRAPLRVAFALASMTAPFGASAETRGDPPLPPQHSALARPALATWTARREHAGIIYFLFGTPSRIDRYDTAASAWLPSIALPSVASTFDVDESGIYLGTGDGVQHFDLSGTPLGTLPTVPGAQAFLDLAGDVLLTGAADTIESYSKTSGAAIDTISCFFDLQGYSIIASEGRLFAVDVGVSPGDILVTDFDPASGQLGTCVDSPYHGVFPYGQATFARAAGGIVIDNNGTAYASDGLLYLGSLGGGVQDIAYLQDSFVAMRGADLVRFSYNLRELGRAVPPAGFADIVAVDDGLFAITSEGGALSIAPFPLDAFTPPVPPPARSWSDTARKADFILGDAGSLYFVNATEHAAYPFSAASWAYGDPVGLFAAPELAAYSAANDSIYASYDGGAIYGFPVGEPGRAAYIASTVYSPNGLATAGEFILASDYSGAWDTHFTFAADGTRLSRVDWNYYSRQYEWDPVRRRMYFFRDDTSPDDLQWEEIATDGTITDAGETPYHGEVDAQVPIRVSSDGSTVIIGSGQVFETGGLTMVGNLGYSLADVAWSPSGDIYGVSAADPPQFLRFSPSYAVVSSGGVRGTPRRLLPYGSNFVYVADVGATTIVGILDGFLSKADLAVDPVALGSMFGEGSPLQFDVTLGNNGSVTATGARVSADLSALDASTWQCITDTSGVAGCDGAEHPGPTIDASLTLEAGAQVHYHVTGLIGADAVDAAAIPFGIEPAVPTSDPELRNNQAIVRVLLDELFRGTFDGT